MQSVCQRCVLEDNARSYEEVVDADIGAVGVGEELAGFSDSGSPSTTFGRGPVLHELPPIQSPATTSWRVPLASEPHQLDAR
jgi:hypothetical protein